MLGSIKTKLLGNNKNKHVNDETTQLLAQRSLDQVRDEGEHDKYFIVYWVSSNEEKSHLQKKQSEANGFGSLKIDLLHLWCCHVVTLEW